MDLPLTPTQEEKLNAIARHEGKNVGDLLVATVSSLLASEEQRWADVEHALGQAERGELIEEDEMDERVARMLAK